ncbi:hypothetical protein Salat_1866700, partial [Sesamum alatum]
VYDEVVKARPKALDEGEQKGYDRGRVEGFDEGLIEGRARYHASDEHKTLLAGPRVEAARDFMKTSTFGIALEIKTVRSTTDAFELCRLKIKTKGGFVEDFDQNRLNPNPDAKLQIPNMDEPNEFDDLIDEIEGAVPPP